MRKATKRLLTVCIAALAVGACQDNIIVQDPPAPPPPPPPPGVDATVSILGLDLIPGPGSVNPTAVAGDINVSLNIEEGDNTVTAVDLLFNGAPIGCATINTNTVPGQGVSLSTAGGADVVECFWNTDDFAGVCDGSNLPPAFANGTHTLGAEITLDDGTKRTASNTQQVTLVNADLMTLTMLSSAPSVVTQGVTWFGGPTDIELAVCPVSFAGTTVGSVDLGLSSLGVIAAGGAPADIDGAGAATTTTDAAEPFVFTIEVADNDRDTGTLLENVSSGAPGDGHDFTTAGTGGPGLITGAGTVFDDGGLNVTTQFASASLLDIYLDMTSPLPNSGGASAVEIDGGPALAVWYDSGDFGITNISELGVSAPVAAGGVTFDVGDCSDANFDADPTTAFTVLFPASPGIADHTEDDWQNPGDGFGGTDAGAECFGAEVVVLGDALGNIFDLTTVAAIQTAIGYGVDTTAPAESDVLPDPAVVTIMNPSAATDDYTCTFAAGTGECEVTYDQADPDLASGDPGSGIGPDAAEDEDANALPTAGFGAGDEIAVDITSLGDGPHTVTVDIEDLATGPNGHSFDIALDLDDTAPAHGALNPAPVGSAGTDAVAIVMTIGGTITDTNIIDSAVLTILDNVAGVCGDGDDVALAVGSAANEVDVNDVDLTDGTGAIAFNQSFTVQQPSALAVTTNYCFVIVAEDESVLIDGTDQGNVSSLSSIVAVTWNVG